MNVQTTVYLIVREGVQSFTLQDALAKGCDFFPTEREAWEMLAQDMGAKADRARAESERCGRVAQEATDHAIGLGTGRPR